MIMLLHVRLHNNTGYFFLGAWGSTHSALPGHAAPITHTRLVRLLLDIPGLLDIAELNSTAT
jgi:hypothetical protein